MKELHRYLFKPLVLIGALNWGLIGFFGFNLVAWLFGPMSILSAIIYCAVGLSAVFCIIAMLAHKREEA